MPPSLAALNLKFISAGGDYVLFVSILVLAQYSMFCGDVLKKTSTCAKVSDLANLP